MGKLKDLTWQIFGRLIVLGRAPNHITPGGQSKAMWYCICNCGSNKILTVMGTHLKSGHTTSCGCIQVERAIEANTKRNKYDEKNGIGYIEPNIEFYFSLEDYEKIKDHSWYISNNGYVQTRIGNKIVGMHRLVMDAPDGMCVDHIDHNTLNNRRENLRVCTIQENNFNQLTRSDSISGRLGVVQCGNKWLAQIGYNKKRIDLGIFSNKEDAINARIEAEKKYFGDFRCILNDDITFYG